MLTNKAKFPLAGTLIKNHVLPVRCLRILPTPLTQPTLTDSLAFFLQLRESYAAVDPTPAALELLLEHLTALVDSTGFDKAGEIVGVKGVARQLLRGPMTIRHAWNTVRCCYSAPPCHFLG